MNVIYAAKIRIIISYQLSVVSFFFHIFIFFPKAGKCFVTQGEQWSIYSLTGFPAYTGLATGDKDEIPLPGRGIYLVRSAAGTVKVIN